MDNQHELGVQFRSMPYLCCSVQDEGDYDGCHGDTKPMQHQVGEKVHGDNVAQDHSIERVARLKQALQWRMYIYNQTLRTEG